MNRLLVAVLLLVTLAGCGSTTLDTTSEESLKASMKAMGDKLGDDDKKKLAGAVMMFTMGDVMAAGMSGKKVEMHEAAKELNGLTAEQIIAKWKERAEKSKAR